MGLEQSLQLTEILHKWSPALLKGWQARNVELKNRKIKWYLVDKGTEETKRKSEGSESGQEARGIINFDLF